MVLDPGLHIVAVTEAYLEATMTKREEMLQRHLFDVFPDNPADEGATGTSNLGDSLRRVLAHRKPDTMAVQRYDVRRPDGSWDVRYWSPMNTPVLDRRGEVAYIVHRGEDVTDYVNLEAQSSDMEREIVTRSQELQRVNAQLREASTAKDEFLSRMSHELRTPLTAVSGFSELLSLSELEPRQREWAGLVRSASQHLGRLIDDVLDISRIVAGRMSLSLEAVALGPLLYDVLELLRPLAERHEVTLEPVTSPGGHGYAFADSRRLKQVMINLIVNAIKYNRRGGTVKVAIGPGDEPDRVKIQVADTGCGIDSSSQTKLFVPFERLDAADSGIDGVGLGLALSLNLVEAMRGTMGVTSVLGTGSTFWVELARGDEVTIPDPEGDVRAALTERSYGGARRVLYVEDTLANIRLIEAILGARPDVELIPAMQGQLGLELAREHVPDLILLDVHLPDLDGDEVLARLQGDDLTHGIPVVILSADATEQQTKRLITAGAAAYLTKPIDVTRLLETLDRHLAAPSVSTSP